jgi:bifunctional enzyme CysN/CysC
MSNLAKKEVMSQEKINVDEHTKEQLKIVIVGHVDHGKSTLVGRLFYETDSLPEGQFEKVKKSCENRGMPFEWSFLTDALQSERDQGITVDTTQIWFKTPRRDYVIIDAPGHKEFLKNMISGAASSEAALLIIDAKEGVKEQSKRHGYLLHLLGVRQIAVAVNKMDLVGYDEKTFRDIEKEYTAYLKDIGVTPKFIIPISAREGDNIVKKSDNMKWYKGPAITEALDQFQQLPALTQLPLRFPVQDVYKFDERRIIVGRIESGKLSVGDKIIFSPHNRVETVASIELHNSPAQNTVFAGQSVGITLKNQIFVERGNVASHAEGAPKLTNIFRAKLFWLSDKALEAGKKYKLKLATATYQVEVKEVEKVVDTNDLAHSDAKKLERSGVGEVIFRSRSLLALDDFADNSITGRFTVVDGYDTVGGGIIDTNGFADQRKKQTAKSENITSVNFKVTRQDRELANGHKGGVLWFSGLSGSGKSTLAGELQNRLFRKGYSVYVLDGDNIRQGLNSDLGFSDAERHENLRRVAEVANLFADSGTIVITSFIAPFKEDRNKARGIAPDNFHSVYIKASLEVCEARDPKGLYKKARSGQIKGFTGLDSPFEEPENADITIDSAKNSVEENVQHLLSYVDEHFVKPIRESKDFIGSEI